MLKNTDPDVKTPFVIGSATTSSSNCPQNLAYLSVGHHIGTHLHRGGLIRQMHPRFARGVPGVF
jgi:hypothetical protein